MTAPTQAMHALLLARLPLLLCTLLARLPLLCMLLQQACHMLAGGRSPCCRATACRRAVLLPATAAVGAARCVTRRLLCRLLRLLPHPLPAAWPTTQWPRAHSTPLLCLATRCHAAASTTAQAGQAAAPAASAVPAAACQRHCSNTHQLQARVAAVPGAPEPAATPCVPCPARAARPAGMLLPDCCGRHLWALPQLPSCTRHAAAAGPAVRRAAPLPLAVMRSTPAHREAAAQGHLAAAAAAGRRCSPLLPRLPACCTQLQAVPGVPAPLQPATATSSSAVHSACNGRCTRTQTQGKRSCRCCSSCGCQRAATCLVC